MPDRDHLNQLGHKAASQFENYRDALLEWSRLTREYHYDMPAVENVIGRYLDHRAAVARGETQPPTFANETALQNALILVEAHENVNLARAEYQAALNAFNTAKVDQQQEV